MSYHNRLIASMGKLQFFSISFFLLIFYRILLIPFIFLLIVSGIQLKIMSNMMKKSHDDKEDPKYIRNIKYLNRFLYIAFPATFFFPSAYAIKRYSLKHTVNVKDILNGNYEIVCTHGTPGYKFRHSHKYKYLDEIKVLTNDPAYIRRELSYVDNITGLEFEDYCANLLRGIGYTSVRVTRSTADFGLDIIAVRNNETYGFQCKLYNSHVNYKAVQETLAGREYYRLDHAVVVTNNDFTKNALKAARRFNIELWNRVDLINIIKEIKIIKLMNAKQALVKINGTFHK